MDEPVRAIGGLGQRPYARAAVVPLLQVGGLLVALGTGNPASSPAIGHVILRVADIQPGEMIILAGHIRTEATPEPLGAKPGAPGQRDQGGHTGRCVRNVTSRCGAAMGE